MLKFVMLKGMVKIIAPIQMITGEQSIQDLFTTVMYANECFTAIYRSTFIKAMWRSDAVPSILTADADSCLFT